MIKKRVVAIISIAVLMGVMLIICCNVAVRNAAEAKMYSSVENIPYNRVGVLLGTNPVGRTGQPNPFYNHRIEACVALYKAGKIERILVSGDNSRTTYDEPSCIKADLVAAGVPDSVIYLDYAGFRTLDSIVRAQNIFGLNKFTIISQQFHNERALYIAIHNDIDAIAFNAQDVTTKYWQVRMMVREWLARVNAVIDVFVGKQPHFLGEHITIE